MYKKKYFLVLFLILSIFSVAIADTSDVYVQMTQFAQSLGGTYSELSSPFVKYSSLTDGTVNLKYDFSVQSKKDLKSDFVYCKIEAPQGIKLSPIDYDSIAGFEIDGSQYPALLENPNSVEFFIPVINNRKGCIQLQLQIPPNFIGNDIPIKANFDLYKKYSKIGIAAIAAAATAVGGVLFLAPTVAVVGGKYLYDKNKEKNISTVREQFYLVKKKYTKHSLANSMKQFRIQVRE